MERKGLSGIILIIIVIILILLIIVFLIFSKGSDSSGESEQEPGAAPNSSQTSVTPPTSCPDYQDSATCGNNYYNVTNETGVCVWNGTTGSCELSVKEQPEENLIDLRAVSLTLETTDCDDEEKPNDPYNSTYLLCEIKITGILQNAGTKTIENPFSVRFLDITNITTTGTVHIETSEITAPLQPNAEKEIILTYKNLTIRNYWIKFIIDPLDKITESDESNNDITKLIKVTNPFP